MKAALPLILLWLLLPVSSACAAELPLPAGQRVVEPFDFHGVRLQPGPLRAQMEEVRAFYLSIPDDDLLKGFRARAGRPAPGKDLGGWYSSDGDEITLHLPMKPWVSPLVADQPTPTAAVVGPVVLAFEAPNARALRALEPARLDRVLVPVKGQPLNFKVPSSPAIVRGFEVLE